MRDGLPEGCKLIKSGSLKGYWTCTQSAYINQIKPKMSLKRFLKVIARAQAWFRLHGGDLDVIFGSDDGPVPKGMVAFKATNPQVRFD